MTSFYTDFVGDKFNLANKKRCTKEYRTFREEVLKRDNYTCQICGCKEKLEVHHIKSVCEYPELIYEISNGQVLCHNCHTKTDSYFVPKYYKRKEKTIMSNENQKISLRVNTDLYLRLKKLSSITKISINGLILLAITKFLKYYGI